jgi:hypothetical protein
LITCCNLHFELCSFFTPNSTEPCKPATLSLSLSLSLSPLDYTTKKKDLNNFLGEEDHFRGQEKRDFFFFFFGLSSFFFFDSIESTIEMKMPILEVPGQNSLTDPLHHM